MSPDTNPVQHPVGTVVHPSGRPCRKWNKKNGHSAHDASISQQTKTLNGAMINKIAQTEWENTSSIKVSKTSGRPCSKQASLKIVTKTVTLSNRPSTTPPLPMSTTTLPKADRYPSGRKCSKQTSF